MSAPAVSICIPAYKAEKYIRATLDSVRAQTFTDWEIIVTEDGSRDSTEQIVNDFARTVTQPVRYTRQDPNGRSAVTRNTSLSHATGHWIAMLDSDDLWTPDHLESMLAKTESAPCDVVYCGIQLFDSATGQNLELRSATSADQADPATAIYTNALLMIPSSVLMARSCFQRFGPVSVDFPVCNDTELWLRFLRCGAIFRFSGRNTCLYRQHPESLTKNVCGTLAETAAVYGRFSDWSALPAKLRRRRPSDLYRYAAQNAPSVAEARQLLCQAVRANPRDSRNWAKLALACIGRR